MEPKGRTHLFEHVREISIRTRKRAIAKISLFPGRQAAFSQMFESTFGVRPSFAGRRVRGADWQLSSIGPTNFLFTANDPHIVARIAAALTTEGTVIDLSSGYVFFRVNGVRAREFLQRGTAIDLDSKRFGVDQVAVTTCAEISVIVERDNDGADGPVFELAVAPSLAESFVGWLRESSAEFEGDVSIFTDIFD